MKKKLSLLMVALVAVAAFAVQIGRRAAQEVTYALAEGDTFTSGQTVDVKNGEETVATITYGETGGADFAAAAASNSIEGFTAYTAGNGTNGNKSGGTFYTINPVYAGSISVAVKLGADKVFHIAEDGVDLAAYNGITVAETYYGTYTFDVKAGSSYKVYCDGSKLGFFGFKYSYEVGEESSEVTFDIAANPWNHALGSGTGETADVGNITEPIVDGGVTLAFDQGSAAYACRFWTGPQIRVYKGSNFSLTAPEGKAITKIEITSNNASYTSNPAGLTEKTWEGNSTGVIFYPTATVQLTKIVVTLADKNSETTAPVSIANTIDEPYTVANAYDLIDAGLALTDVVYVKGTISQIDSYASGAITYWISDDGTTTKQLECYKGKGLDGAAFTAAEDLTVGQEVIVKGNLSKHNDIYEFAQGNEIAKFVAAEPEDIEISPADGDIAAALAAAKEGKTTINNITINLTAGAAYTVGASLEPGAGTFTINGNGAAITATEPLISLPATPVVEANAEKADFFELGAITIDNVKLSTSKAVVKSNAKYLVSKIDVTNSVIELTAAVSPFDFGGGAFGYPTELNMKSSTLWASVTNNKPYFTSQSGNSPKDINNGAEEKQTIAFENCTLYNICYGANFNNLRQRGQKFLVFTVKNNVIVNCGKDNFLQGMDGGQSSASPTWTVDGNIFGKIVDGVYTDLAESQTGNGEVTNTVAGTLTFNNVTTGDFGGTFTLAEGAVAPATAPGDARWEITFASAVPEGDIVISPADGDIAAALAAAKEGKTTINNITINLAEGAAYTVGASLEPGAGTFTINGNGATITATEPLVSLPATPVVEANAEKADFYELGAITIDNVKLSTSKAVVKSNAKYLVSKIDVTNSVIELTAAVSPFDFGGGAFGYPTELNMKSSTLWASVTNNKPYFTSQSGNSPKDINNGAEEKQTIAFENCTLYNICSGANFNNLRQRGQKFLVFTVKNNVIVNCGKDNFLQGMDGGQSSASPTWTVDGNIFGKIVDGVYTDLAESQTGNGEVTNTLTGIMNFTNAAEGNFGGTFEYTSATAPETVGGDPRWTIAIQEYVDPNLLWSSETAVPCNWAGEIQIAADKLANVKVGDKIHVAVEGVTPAGEWDAQVALYDGAWATLEQSIAVGLGDKDDVAFTVTGDIKRLIQAYGMMISGTGFSSKKVWLEPAAEALGSDNSIFVGSHNVQLPLNINHFKNANDKNGVAAGDKLVVTCTAIDPAPDNVWFVLSDGNWADVEGAAFTDIEGGKEYTFTAEVAEIANTKGLIINQNGYTITQVELVPAPKPEDIEIAATDIVEGDITAAIAAASEGKIVKNITINLAAETAYKVTAPIVANQNLVIIGNGATIDASALDKAFIQLNAEPTASFLPKADGSGDTDYYGINLISISGVTVNGLKSSIFYDNNVKYCVLNFTIDNSIFALATESVNNDALISFQAGGAKDFAVLNSTIYGNNAGAKYFVRYNNSSRIDRYGFAETDTWSFTYQNNTFANLLTAEGQWGNYSGIVGKTAQGVISVKNNIWVDCDENTMRRMLHGKKFADFKGAGCEMANNIFNREGAVVDQGDYGNGSDLNGVVTFAEGADNFNATIELAYGVEAPAAQPGDPRWSISYTQAPQKFTITVAEATNGVVAVEPTTAAAGETVTITATPAEGYEIDEVKVECTTINEAVIVTEGEIPGTYTYTQPADDVVVTVTFKLSTGINSISVAAAKYGEGDWYTINGTRIEMPTKKGLYIHNGKKVVVK